MKIFFSLCLLLLSPLLFAPASRADEALSDSAKEAEIQKCLDRYIPPGSRSSDQSWYDPKKRCEVSTKVPMSKSGCESAVKKLQELAVHLNSMVTEQCREYVPQLTSIGCTRESQQTACLQKRQELLLASRGDAAKVKASLHDFIEQTRELKKMGINGAASVQTVLNHCESNRQDMGRVDASLAQTTGTQTMGDFYNNTNSGQGADPLKKLIGDFTQNNSDVSGTADAAALASQQKSLDQSWQQMGQVKSPLAIEHLTNFLDAQDMQLKVTAYQQDLDKLGKQAQTMANTDGQNSSALTTAGQDPSSSAPGGAAAAAGAGNAAASLASGEGSSNGRNAPAGSVPSSDPTRSETTATPSTALASPSNPPASGPAGAAAMAQSNHPVEAQTQDGTGGSRSAPANGKLGSALRDALRQHLGTSTFASAATAASGPAAGSADTAAPFSVPSGPTTEGSRRPASVAGDGFTGDTFEGSLNKGGFSMHGTESEKSVHSFIQEFGEGTQYAQADAGIGAAEGQSLFERVKSFHQKCARKGCVGIARLAKE